MLRAAQLIYTRVETDYSYQSTSGFQTAYKSKTLSERDIRFIESRVKCYRPKKQDVRLQFFNLPDRKVVLSKTHQIDHSSEIVDKAGRKGAFIAHCLVLDDTEFGKIGYNPFIVFDQFDFVTQPKMMIQRFGKATGVAPITTIASDACPPNPARFKILNSWDRVELLKLVSLGLQASTMSTQGRSLLLLNKQSLQSDFLRELFWLIPEGERRCCSFDTCMGGCPISSDSYWAIGSTSYRSDSSYILVDTERQKVSIPANKDHYDHLYYQWLKYVLQNRDLVQVVEGIDTAQRLADAFAEERVFHLDHPDTQSCREIFRLNQAMIWERFNNSIFRQIDKDIAKNLSLHMQDEFDYSYHDGLVNLLKISASGKIEPSDLANAVLTWLEDGKPDLEKSDLTSLQILAQRAQNPKLLFLSSCLGRKTDTKLRDQALQNMDHMTFKGLMEWILQPIAPKHFVSPKHVETLLSSSKLGNMDNSQLVDLVESIVEVGAGNELELLSPYIANLNSSELHAVERVLEKSRRQIPGEFKWSVEVRRRQLGPHKRFFGLF